MKRQLNQEIINYLYHQSDFVTSEQIALELDVSKATVTRRIAEINLMKDGTGQKIVSERGRGYKLSSEVYFRFDGKQEESVADERCNEIIKELLFASPKRLRTYELYEKFYVSESVIAKDRTIISKKLEKWNLSLVRSNRHMSIAGAEKNIRAAIMGIVLNLNQTTDIAALEEYCKGISNEEDFKFTIQQLEYAYSALGMTIDYPYNISLFAHIYVLIERIRMFRHINTQSPSPVLLREEKLFLPEIYSVCKIIIDNIGHYTGIVPDEAEVTYLFEYLSTSRISHQTEMNLDIPLSNQIATSYIEKIGSRLGKTFSIELKQELEKHVSYLIQRLSNGIYLSNALLHDIQVEYQSVYVAVCESSKEISREYHLPTISVDESGFICLYFAKFLELERRKLNAYVVCTTGIGTSELIAVKIRKSLPDIEIVGVTSNTSIQKIVDCMDEQIDLLITTIPLPQNIGIPTVLVSSILTSRDIETIVQKMEEIRYAN